VDGRDDKAGDDVTPAGWFGLAAALALYGSQPATSPRHRQQPGHQRHPSTLPIIAGPAIGCTSALLGGTAGVIAAPVLAIVVAAAVTRLANRATRRPPDPRTVALLLDLIAATLTAGQPPDAAIRAVVSSIGPDTPNLLEQAIPLGRVGRLLELGAEPSFAWADLQSVPEFRPVAIAARRCASSGARLAGALHGVASELRALSGAAALARAERLGVWSLLPLGLCFLPAFVCIGIVPVISGVASQVLSGVPK
jgi:pilus assembly protein TadC